MRLPFLIFLLLTGAACGDSLPFVPIDDATRNPHPTFCYATNLLGPHSIATTSYRGAIESDAGAPGIAGPPQLALDGSDKTFWACCVTNADPSTAENTLTVDLQREFLLGAIVADWHPDQHPVGSSVSLSIDGTSFTTVATRRDGTFDPVPARYVRVTGHGATEKTRWLYLRELRVFVAGNAPPPNIAPPPAPIAVVPATSNGTLSAAIYDAQGNLLRTLLRALPTHGGSQAIYWDERDDAGNVLPPGKYEWRAITSLARGVDEGSVGNTGHPPQGLTAANAFVLGVAVDARDNLYTISWWEEAHMELRKYAADGTPLWGQSCVGGMAIAADDRYVFVAMSPDSGSDPKNRQDTVRRFHAADGKPAPFANGANGIVVNANKTDPKRPGYAKRTFDEQCRWEAIRGLALDGARLWVSNFQENRIEAYDRETGAKLETVAVPKPLGLAARDGAVWVVNSGDRVTKIENGKPTHSITGLARPYGLSIGGTRGHLFVTEAGAGRILEYDVAAAPRLAGLKRFGGIHVPGPVRPDRFAWNSIGTVAVDSRGRLSVTDAGNYRVQRFLPNGRQWQSFYSEFQPAPFVDKFPSKYTHQVLSKGWESAVDLRTGRWQPSHNWRPLDGRFTSTQVLRRTLKVNGRARDFIIHVGHGQRACFYAVEPRGVRRCAIVGGSWNGPDDDRENIWARWTWTDRDGDGEIDWDEKAPGLSNGEVTFTGGLDGKEWSCWFGMWVDETGALWMGHTRDAQGRVGVGKIPLRGFDALGNPLYDWNDCEVLVPSDADFLTKNVRIARDGDLYVLAAARNVEAVNGLFHMGGNVVARYDAKGNLKSRYSVLGGNCSAFGIDADAASGIWYTGHSGGDQHWIHALTPDGLVICTMRPGAPNDHFGGWLDHYMAIWPFIQPGTKQRYVYAEEVVYGKSIRYRLEGFGHVERHAGTVTVPRE